MERTKQHHNTRPTYLNTNQSQVLKYQRYCPTPDKIRHENLLICPYNCRICFPSLQVFRPFQDEEGADIFS